MAPAKISIPPRIQPEKFQDPELTRTGARRASVELVALQTLWFNTGTLCNLACANCYIDSSPTNDSLVYLQLKEVRTFLDEISMAKHLTTEIGFTGGEPFMNPDLMDMLMLCLRRGFAVLVLTNATKPMMKCCDQLSAIQARFPGALRVRVSLDHFSQEQHQIERGPHSWEPAIKGLRWLCANGFQVDIAGRMRWSETESEMRAGYESLFRKYGLNIDANDHARLVLFPEMDSSRDVPEITESCWETLGISPTQTMCATSRMVIKRRGALIPTVVPCTLLAGDPKFELGDSLMEAKQRVTLNHPHCSRFCVLGGASCSTHQRIQ